LLLSNPKVDTATMTTVIAKLKHAIGGFAVECLERVDRTAAVPILYVHFASYPVDVSPHAPTRPYGSISACRGERARRLAIKDYFGAAFLNNWNGNVAKRYFAVSNDNAVVFKGQFGRRRQIRHCAITQ
jgi:hypothetical protein